MQAQPKRCSQEGHWDRSAPVLGHPLDLARIVNYGTTDNSSCNTTVKVRSTHYAPPGGYFWCNGTLTKLINASFPPLCTCYSSPTAKGSGATGYSVTSAAQLEDKLCVAIEASAASLASLQRQIMSLAQVTLQNRRALDLLTAEKGGSYKLGMREIGRVAINQMLLHPFVRLSVEAPSTDLSPCFALFSRK
ncbi:Endogenous retrovirus group FC1 Env polyprotein [Plecturocebus cupreus]